MSNNNIKNQLNYIGTFVGIIVIGAILMMPLDRNQVQADLNNSGTLGRYFQDCKATNERIDEAGGAVPYYFGRVRATKKWQNEIGQGNTQLNNRQHQEMQRELEKELRKMERQQQRWQRQQANRY